MKDISGNLSRRSIPIQVCGTILAPLDFEVHWIQVYKLKHVVFKT